MERKHFIHAAGLAILGIAAPTKVTARAVESHMAKGITATLNGIESYDDLLDLVGKENAFKLAMSHLTVKVQMHCRVQAKREMEMDYARPFEYTEADRNELRSRTKELTDNYCVTSHMFRPRPRKPITIPRSLLAPLTPDQVDLLRKSGVRVI